MKKQLTFLILIAFWLVPATTSGQGQPVGVLTLDSLSFISFEGYENLTIPAGSTVSFTFGTPNSDGSVPFTIQPGGVSIPPIPLWSTSGQLRYTLATPAQGTMQNTSQGIRVSFSAAVAVTLEQEGGGTFNYQLPFSTESVSATNSQGTNTVSLSGARIVLGPNHIQLAAAVTNEDNAFPQPGRAVYSILSGTFDSLPQFP